MGDEKDPNASIASDAAPSAVPAAPISVVPRPVNAPPRPLGSALPTSRMPPPPSSRGILPGALAPRTTPPPPPQRNLTPPPISAVAASPSVVPRAPATPPPPPQRHTVPPSFSRPLTEPPLGGVTAQLEQRLGASQVELRKLGSERHTLRARLRRETDRLRELESALRAEKELRAQASEDNFAAILGLRSRLAEVESERDTEQSRLQGEVEGARAELQAARSELEQARSELDGSRGELDGLRGELTALRGEWERAQSAQSTPAAADTSPARSAKIPQGLRRIRGIGPGYQRVLEQFGVTRVQQIAVWTDTDVLAFADKLKIRPDRITKDAWIPQARALEPDPDPED